jgi:hypothetical protein
MISSFCTLSIHISGSFELMTWIVELHNEQMYLLLNVSYLDNQQGTLIDHIR